MIADWITEQLAKLAARVLVRAFEIAEEERRPAAPPTPARDGILAGWQTEVERRRRAEAKALYDAAEAEASAASQEGREL